jgi:hypothetical protein
MAWFAVIAAVLTGTTASAQQGKVRLLGAVARADSTFATNHNQAPANPTLSLPPGTVVTLPNQPPVTLNQPMVINAHEAPVAPPATIGAPVAHDAPCQRHCSRGATDFRPYLECLWDWLCYQPIKGGCPKKGSCGSNCSIPLYAYFMNACTEGRKYEMPPCCSGCNKGCSHKGCNHVANSGDAGQPQIHTTAQVSQPSSSNLTLSGFKLFSRSHNPNCR